MTERIRQLAAVVISMIVICVSTVTFVGWSIDQNNKKLCAVIEVIIEPDPNTPPLTDRSKRAAQELTKLTHEYHC
jgi:hypothetical protein